MADYPAPAPAPYPTDFGSVQGASTTDWNSQWNTIWNQAYNAGWNRSGINFAYDPSFQSAIDEGYSRGIQDQVAGDAYSPTGGTTTQQQTTGGTGGVYTGPSPDDQLLSSIFDPTMNYLNQAESTIQQQQPGVEGDILAQYGTSKTSLEGEKASGERNLMQSEEKAGRTKTDAASAARRLYQELVSGGRQRFGGATSAGQAYGELTANQLQRGLGTVQQQFTETMQKIDGYRQDLQLKFTTALQQLEDQKNSAINEAKRYFQDKLLEISRLKAETESNKSMARLTELQNLRNQVYAINLQAYQTQQQWAMTQKNAEELLNKYQQQALQNVTGGQGAAQAYNPPITNRLSMTAPAGTGNSQLMGMAGPPLFPTRNRIDDTLDTMEGIQQTPRQRYIRSNPDNYQFYA